VPQLPSDRVDSDPLLEFSSEPGAPAPKVQPPEDIEDAPPLAASELVEPLRKRVETLERSLERATKVVARLKAQVATLVGAARDNSRSSSSHRAVSAIAGIAVGIALAVSMWIYASGDEPIMSAAAVAPPVAAAEPAVPVDPIPSSQTETPGPAAVPVAMRVVATAAPSPREQSRPAVTSVDYVGTLSIDASPGGDVFVNRQAAGHTPLRLEHLKAGSHLIWIERDGYRRWTRVVEVPADRVSRVFADLEPVAPR
jgi:hypothetical protein